MSQVTHLRPGRERLTQQVFAAVDAQDPEALIALLAPDALQRFGNSEPFVGRDAIRQANVDFFSIIAGLSHRIVDAWESAETVTVRLEVTYRRLDGGVVTLPCVTLLHLRVDDLIDTYEVFADMAPVFAPQPAAT